MAKNSFANYVFSKGDNSKPKYSAIDKYISGKGAKQKKGEAYHMIFGGRKQPGHKGVAKYVLGDDQKPQRKGISALIFGSDNTAANRRPSIRYVKYHDLEENDTVMERSPKILKKLLNDRYIKKNLPKMIRNKNGKTIESRELRDKIIKLAHEQPRGFFGDKPGLTVKKLRKLLKEDKKLGFHLDHQTAERVATVMGYNFYEPPEEGMSREEIQRLIKQAKASAEMAGRTNSGMAGEALGRRSDPSSALKKGEARADRINAKTIENIDSAVSIKAAKKGSQTSAFSGKETNASASIEQGKDSKGITNTGIGANKSQAENDAAEDTAGKAASAGSSQPVVISGGAGYAGAKSGRPPSQLSDYGDDDIFFGKVVNPHTGNVIDFKKEIEKRKTEEKDNEDASRMLNAA